jgi:glucose/arabinose dehydrogenase
VRVSGPIRVIDGDTLETAVDGKRTGVGVIGINAPPGNTDCGRAAAAALQALVQNGIRLEVDPDLTLDDRGRRLYYVLTGDGRSVALELATAGLVAPLDQGRERDALATATSDARGAGQGCSSPSVGGPDSQPAALLASTATASAAQAPTKLPNGFAEDVVASGLTNPRALAFLPDGRILVGQKDGVVRLIKGGALVPTPFIDLRDRVNDYWDRGLLGIAVDPAFTTNGYVYIYYVYENDASQYSGTKTGRLARYVASGDVAPSESEAVLLGSNADGCSNAPAADCIPVTGPSFGGDVAVAGDGSLFVSTGDGASFNFADDQALQAQDLDTLAGKVLRVSNGGLGLSTNPFWDGNPTSNRSRVWAYGLHQPARLALRPGSNVPYVGNVGWTGSEAAYAAGAGANLGWPCFEGTIRQSAYGSKAVCQALLASGTGAVTAPLVAYDHGRTDASVVGGPIYGGTLFPGAYQGAYFYADTARGFIRWVRLTGSDTADGRPADFATGAGAPVALGVGLDQHLYYLEASTGQLRRVHYGSSGPTSCPVGQYLADYFNNRNLSGPPTFSRCEMSINYNWGTDGPGNGIATDNFSVRWTGRYSFTAGDYVFIASADDGMRAWVDGRRLFDGWHNQPSTEYRATRGFTSDGEHDLKVEYYDADGRAVAQFAWQTDTNPNQAPTATILTPGSTLHFKVGDTVSFSGSATDPENGQIPPSRLAWTATIQHCLPNRGCHHHPLATQPDANCPATASCGTFVAPDHDEDFYVELKLVATDTKGLTGTSTLRLDPQTTAITIDTAPGGLQITYAGVTSKAPITRSAIVGGSRAIAVASPQGSYGFASWSDGGAQEHSLVVPTTDAVYTASFSATGGTSAGDERLTNSGFDQGLTGWTRPAWYANVADADTTVVHSGTGSVHFRGNSGGTTIYQDVPAAQGETLAFSGWINVQVANSEMNGAIELLALSGNRSTLATFTLYKIYGPTSGWVRASAFPTMPEGTSQVRLRVYFPSLDGTVYVDDFSLRRGGASP